jgi:cell division protein FtsZ
LEQIEEPPRPAPKISIQPEPEVAPPTPPAADVIAFEQPQPAAEELPAAPPAPLPAIKKPTPRLIPPKKKAVIEKEAATTPPKEKCIYAKQEVMQFEPITRGRFEKSEPTIVEGQDLDVPTFLRKNIRVK